MSTESMPQGHAFNHRQRLVLRALMERLFASDRPEDTTPSQVDLADRFSRWLSLGDPLARIGFKILIWFCNWLAPLFFLGMPRRFVSLDEKLQDRLLERWTHTKIYPLRMLLFGIWLTSGIVYFDLPDVKSDLGTDQRCLLDAAEEGS